MLKSLDAPPFLLPSYNLASELTSIDGPWANDAIALSYDALGRSTGRSINSTGTNALLYDNYGRPSTVSHPLGTFTSNYPTAVSTLVSSITSTAGPSTTFSYLDAVHDQRLGGIWHKDSGAQTISKFDYEYSVLGQITKWGSDSGSGNKSCQNVSNTFANSELSRIVA